MGDGELDERHVAGAVGGESGSLRDSRGNVEEVEETTLGVLEVALGVALAVLVEGAEENTIVSLEVLVAAVASATVTGSSSTPESSVFQIVAVVTDGLATKTRAEEESLTRLYTALILNYSLTWLTSNIIHHSLIAHIAHSEKKAENYFTCHALSL